MGSDASSGTTSPFWYIRVGAAGTGASSANAGSTAAHKLPASKARRVVGLPHGRSVRPDAAERSAQSTRAVLITGDGVARRRQSGGAPADDDAILSGCEGPSVAVLRSVLVV